MKAQGLQRGARGGSLPFASVRPEVILLPVKPWFVALTLGLAFVLDQLPLDGWMRLVRPDFLVLAILFWCIHEPRLVGVGTAWLLGLAMDVSDATLFGQHALAYAALAYACSLFRRRVLRFTRGQQALHVAVLLAGGLLLTWVVRRVGGAPAVGPGYFLPALTGAVLWPALTLLLQWPQRPTPSTSDL